MSEAVGVESPEAGRGLRKGGAYGRLYLGEVDKAADETSLGDELLKVGRDGGASGENHGVGDGGGSKGEARESAVDDGELDALLLEVVDLVGEYGGGGGARYESLAGREDASGEESAEGGALVGEVEDLGDAATLEIVSLGGDEIHALVESHLRLGGGIDAVGLLAIDTDRGDGGGDAEFVETAEDVVETDGLAGILFKTDDGEAAGGEYVL